MPAVTRKPGSTRARRRDRARTDLLAILRRLLEEGETFSEISVERLACDAGISRTTFYVYFEDKNDLLRAWFGAACEELDRAARGWWELAPGVDRDTRRAALARIVATYRPHGALMVATHDAVGQDPATRRLVEAAMADWIAGLERHIVAGQAAGRIDPSLPPAETAYWLQWMAERGLHQLPADADPESLDRLLDAYTAIVWNTLYAPVPR